MTYKDDEAELFRSAATPEAEALAQRLDGQSREQIVVTADLDDLHAAVEICRHIGGLSMVGEQRFS